MTLHPGLSFIDHTADVGIALDATSVEALFHTAALGMLALLRGQEDEASAEPDAPARGGEGSGSGAGGFRSAPDATRLTLTGAGLAELLAAWLRELLFLHETEHRDYVASSFERLDAAGLEARVRTEPARGAAREIKGVTYHDLVVEPAGSGWRARVIFDV